MGRQDQKRKESGIAGNWDGKLRRGFTPIETLQKEFSIDPDRIYVTGQSMGGYGTWDIIMRKPELFAAADGAIPKLLSLNMNHFFWRWPG